LQRVDYKSDADTARLKINKWVESKTNNKIRNLLTPLNVTSHTKSVLVNTIYFKADWAKPFNKKATKEGIFKTASGDKTRLPLMHRRSEYSYGEDGGLKLLAMPYRGGETEMIFLLPKNAKRLAKLERSLSGAEIQKWIKILDNGHRTDTIVTIPKFKIEKRYKLGDHLKVLGMTIPFSDDSDFSGMKPVNLLSSDENDWNLKISNVIHKVFVEVEEKGTEAAAATAITNVIVVTGARSDKPSPPKIFRADHSFLFMIRDRRTAVVLFIGRFTGDNASVQ
jgi:serpin B